MMGLLEDSLRETFASRAATTPALEDMAGAAIRGATRVRRRRLGIASAAAVFTVALVVVGIGTVRGANNGIDLAGGPEATTGASVTAPPLVGVLLPTDVLNRDRIQLADGQVVSLAGFGQVTGAWRVVDGWLVQTASPDGPARSTLWRLDDRGSRRQVASGDATMVSRGSGSRTGVVVAWVQNGALTVGRYVPATTGGGYITEPDILDRVTTVGVGSLRPYMFVGGGVLLAGSRTGGGLDVWDMWFPDRGMYRATTDAYESLSQVVGVSADRSELVGLYGKPPCLGVQEPQETTPRLTTCGVPMDLDEQVLISPNAGWWAISSMDGLRLYPGPSLWTNPQSTGRFTEPVTSAVWLGTTLVATTPTDVVELSVPNLTLTRRAVLPPAAETGVVAVVEDLRK